jgi:hypothetical protein
MFQDTLSIKNVSQKFVVVSNADGFHMEHFSYSGDHTRNKRSKFVVEYVAHYLLYSEFIADLIWILYYSCSSILGTMCWQTQQIMYSARLDLQLLTEIPTLQKFLL